jgi:hypothetical protein
VRLGSGLGVTVHSLGFPACRSCLFFLFVSRSVSSCLSAAFSLD